MALLKMAGFTPARGKCSRVLLSADALDSPVTIMPGQRFHLGDICFETNRETLIGAGRVTGVYAQDKDGYRDISFVLDRELSVPARIFGDEPEADNALYSEQTGAVSQVRTAQNALNSISQVLPKAGNLTERLESCRIELKDIADEVSTLLENTDFDPSELDHVNDRLDHIYELEKKYHTENVSELITLRDGLKQKLNNIENSDEALAKLEASCQKLCADCQKLADVLTKLRKKAGKEIEGQLRQRLVPLGMPNVRFEVSIAKRELGKTGQDEVSFLFSANTSTPLQSVAQVASGGEIARVMLSLKAMISGAVKLPTIIFDEIDTGVSGKIAEKMADIMKEMGQTERQVISITHLPQIASKGSHHYRVSKEETAQGTISQMQELSQDERINEIAQMLSGSNVTDAAIQNAKELLKI
jgi:DNA repair protein RecN (Recombination protein N)